MLKHFSKKEKNKRYQYEREHYKNLSVHQKMLAEYKKENYYIMQKSKI